MTSPWYVLQAAQQLAEGVKNDTLGLLSATIVSHLFWPELRDAEMTVPAQLEAAMKQYAERCVQRLKFLNTG